jgi:hypothetical protein
MAEQVGQGADVAGILLQEQVGKGVAQQYVGMNIVKTYNLLLSCLYEV